MVQLALLLFAVAGGLAWLTFADRASPLALTIVEYNDLLPLPLYAVAGLAGVVCAGIALAQRMGRASAAAPAPARARGQAPTLRAVQGGAGAGFRDQVTGQAAALTLPPGARLVLDPAVGVPFRLVLEQVPEGRAKRAVGTVGRFVASLPTPPRLQVQFVDCPPSQQPVHVLVRGALSAHLPRGSFKVVNHVDRVDVMFHEHDPVWREQW